jgi:hypothetical protein
LFGAFLLPLLGGSAFQWTHTLGAYILFGSRWNHQLAGAHVNDLLNYWWFDSLRYAVVTIGIGFLVFTVVRIFELRNYRNHFGSTYDSLPLPPIIWILVLLSTSALQWLIAVGDPQRVWPETGTLLRLCVIFVIFETFPKSGKISSING